ncbi:hypothetical protein [Methanobacterium petrolearium]|uniref:hypothetical protein n=1 Tax=Methanobacterium petrolearium TaxID=710190 RepID=UPI001AE25FB4|nr:hypothetical protein [Methanobacterium petrolearium]MBP1945216.1 hypothetical protein [Methanobacterium petrolearium]BDZ71149.1 hypothetical protein GCM10025861_16660 [Methanobacterium petrolearium]
MEQFLITPAMGKRLIAKALANYEPVKEIFKSGTLVIIAGTTNGYVAEEILSHLGQVEGFSRKRFFRGVVLPPSQPRTEDGRLPDETGFPGDVVIVNGKWKKGLTIFDVVDDLKEGDIIFKGANALDVNKRKAAIYIGHPQGGTILASLEAVVGRRTRLILPVGLEKRVNTDLDELALKINSPGAQGPRLLPVLGEVFTEIEAISSLTGVTVQMVAAGGVAGAEGSIWLLVNGKPQEIEDAHKLITSVSEEPEFSI